MPVPSGPLEGAPTTVTVGVTGVNATVKVTDDVAPCPSLAVTVTICAGASSAPSSDQDQLPLPVPDLVSVPAEAERATLSPSGAEYVRLLLAVAPWLADST